MTYKVAVFSGEFVDDGRLACGYKKDLAAVSDLTEAVRLAVSVAVAGGYGPNVGVFEPGLESETLIWSTSSVLVTRDGLADAGAFRRGDNGHVRREAVEIAAELGAASEIGEALLAGRQIPAYDPAWLETKRERWAQWDEQQRSYYATVDRTIVTAGRYQVGDTFCGRTIARLTPPEGVADCDVSAYGEGPVQYAIFAPLGRS